MIFIATVHPHYKAIQSSELLAFPSIKHLQRLTSCFSNTPSTSETINYLKVKSSSLKPEERDIILLIDEVYNSSKLEYSGGSIYGYSENDKDNSELSKTVLAFMIKSVTSKYQDVISLTPISNLTADFLYKKYLK